MLFNSLEFLAFFTAILLLYYALPKAQRARLLLVASYAFYAWWDWRFLGLMLTSTIIDYHCARAIAANRRPSKGLYMAVSVITNLGILAVFKYLGFFTQEFNALLESLDMAFAIPVVSLILPVGLSFYTFQSMGYTIDVYRGEIEACDKPLEFALFVSFFPQLVAGPIERSQSLLPQLQNLEGASARQRAEGIHLMLWGYFKKVYIADNLAVIVAQAFALESNPSGLLILVSAYAFTWQIYCDFSGYTDIARGVAKLLGVDLSINFRLPFFAQSPQELWRRWHISLSQWLRDYLYITLGGNRRGQMRTQLNLLATMVLGGLWHGANWTFMVWGAYHGLALAIQRALPPLKLPRLLAIPLTFHFTCLGFLIFRATDIGQVQALLGGLLSWGSLGPMDLIALKQFIILITPLFMIEFIQYLRGDDLDWLMRWPKPLQWALTLLLLAAILGLGGTYGQQFIYFQF